MVYDLVVVGAGIVGSCTAFHAAKAGLKTLMLEQVLYRNSISISQSLVEEIVKNDLDPTST